MGSVFSAIFEPSYQEIAMKKFGVPLNKVPVPNTPARTQVYNVINPPPLPARIPTGINPNAPRPPSQPQATTPYRVGNTYSNPYQREVKLLQDRFGDFRGDVNRRGGVGAYLTETTGRSYADFAMLLWLLSFGMSVAGVSKTTFTQSDITGAGLIFLLYALALFFLTGTVSKIAGLFFAILGLILVATPTLTTAQIASIHGFALAGEVFMLLVYFTK